MPEQSSVLHELCEPLKPGAWLQEDSQALGALIATESMTQTAYVLQTPAGCSVHSPLPAAAAAPAPMSLRSAPAYVSDLSAAIARGLADGAPDLIAIATVSEEPNERDEIDPMEGIATLIPEGTAFCYTHTPALTGHCMTGYDRQLVSILRALWEQSSDSGTRPVSMSNTLNFLTGIDGAGGANGRELQRILNAMHVEACLLGGNAGPARREPGAITPLAQVRQAAQANACIALQAFGTPDTLSYLAQCGQEIVPLHYPIGIGATDGLLSAISRLTGKPIPDCLEQERGRLLDAIADASAHLHGKSYAVAGNPDFCLGMTLFLLELGVEPRHVVSPSGNVSWKEALTTLLRFTPSGQHCRVYPGKDLSFLRFRLLTDPVDFVIGDPACQFLERDTGTPLVEFAASALRPARDRHDAIWGYQGGLNVLSKLLDRTFRDMDRFSIVPSKTDYSFDIIR